jgi:hypothetical protein
MFHYGWGRPARALQAKRQVTRGFFPHKQPESAPLLPWIPGIRPFLGAHPAIVGAWVDARRQDPDRRVGARFFHRQHIRLYISDLIERLTGHRVFEFRNYTLV